MRVDGASQICDARVAPTRTRILEMPPARIVDFRERDGGVPMLDWFDHLQPKARQKCLIR